MRNRLEGEPMDILHLGGGGAASCQMAALYPWVQDSGVVQNQGEQQICGCQPTKFHCLQEGLSPGCSPDVFVKLLFRTELPELHLVVARALQNC